MNIQKGCTQGSPMNQPASLYGINKRNDSCCIVWIKLEDKKDAVLLRSCKERSRYFLTRQHLEDIASV